MKALLAALLLSTALLSRAALQSQRPAEIMLGDLYPPGVELYEPTDVAVDPVSHKIFVCDRGNDRILRFPAAAGVTPGVSAEIAIGQVDLVGTVTGLTASRLSGPASLAFDPAGRLWVSDAGNNRVLRYDNPATDAAPVAAGVLGQADFTSAAFVATVAGLWYPEGLACSGTTLYVLDAGNSRVLRYDNAAAKTNGAPANAVFGQPDFTSGNSNGGSSGPGANGFLSPSDVAISSERGSFYLWVADLANNRVLGFPDPEASPSTGATATRVLGQPGFSTKTTSIPPAAGSLNFPGYLCSTGSALFISDSNNNRILRWDLPASGSNGKAATMVYGQADFVSTISHPGNSHTRGMDFAAGALWLIALDAGNDRILRYDSALTKSPGAPADFVLTQPVNADADTTLGRAISIAPTSGKIFVCDRAKHRVLRYASYASYATLQAGSEPEAVFGQPNLADELPGSGASQMNFPVALACDSSDLLWVAEQGNNRVIRFYGASTATSGTAAVQVLGQAAWGASGSGLSATKFNFPSGLAVDGSGTLWVADTVNNRVLRFNFAPFKGNGAPADSVLGQSLFISSAAGTSASQFWSPVALAAAAGRLWVRDDNNRRVLRFDNAAGAPNFAAAAGVLGQASFSTSAGGSGAAAMGLGGGSLVVDGVGRLYVGDGGNRRITWFNGAAQKPNGAAADGLLGQPAFGVVTDGWDNLHTGTPAGLALDPSGALWAADDGHHRILRYASITPAITFAGLDLNKHFTMHVLTTPGAKYEVQRSSNLTTWTLYDTLTPAFVIIFWTSPVSANGRSFFRVREVAP